MMHYIQKTVIYGDTWQFKAVPTVCVADRLYRGAQLVWWWSLDLTMAQCMLGWRVYKAAKPLIGSQDRQD